MERRQRVGAAAITPLLLALALAVASVAILTKSHEANAADDELYKAARSEGRVVVIGPSATELQDFFRAFQKRYPGIVIHPMTARGPEMIARLDAEFASGRRQIGVFTTALSTMYLTQKARRFEAWQPPSAKGIPNQYSEDDHTFSAASITPYGILYNTNLVSPEDVPQTWQDLTDPKWRGKILADDPRTPGGGQIMMVGFSRHPDLGWKFIEALGKQDIRFMRERPEVPNAVARGEYPISMPVAVRDYIRLREANAPVRLVLPKAGACECATNYVGVIQGGPQTNAAKLLVNFYFTPEGQSLLAERGDFPVMPGSKGPSGFPPLSEIPLLSQLTKSDVDRIGEYLKRFNGIFFR